MKHKTNNNFKDRRLGIAGVGMVGGAMQRWLEKQGLRPLVYDPPKKLGSLAELNQAEIIFLCVPTPFEPAKGGFDLTYIEQACSQLTGQKTVVVKSTVLPGTTDTLQKKYPQHKFLFNPEFLREAQADQDMQKPDRQLIGLVNEKDRPLADEIMTLLPKAPFQKVVRAVEAELIKYAGNTFLAMKVVFAAQMYQLCQALGLDYEVVKECLAQDKRIGPSHLDALAGGYLGYQGSCFPKDTKSLIQFADSKNIDLKLLKIVEAINDKLMEEQGLKEA